MHRKYMVIIVMISCFLVSCAQKPNVGERNGVRAATSEHEDTEEVQQQNTNEIITNISESISANSVTQRNLDIFANYEGTKIERVIDVLNKESLFIDAVIDVDGINRVSQYEYLTKDITEEVRANLFQSVFLDAADEAEYDELNDVWTLEIDPDIRNYFLYQVSYSNGGTTVSGEQIIILENRYYDLYPFEDNRLSTVSDSKVDVSIDAAIDICKRTVNAIANADNYVADCIQGYGNNGRRSYYKIVFRYMLDGMPVLGYNDLTFLFDNNGIEMVKGSLFSVKEIRLTENILSPDEAVERLQEQADFLIFEDEGQIMVSKVTLEYIVINSPEGKMLITPVWRFWLGNDEDERNFLCHKILAIDALTGGLIWDERGHTM
ncbi:MAG: hypothetical protein NC489_27945 [Ruminococcus flavefaciens]|nr:hypothetical protein [Ruminococcus flavefaciens]